MAENVIKEKKIKFNKKNKVTNNDESYSDQSKTLLYLYGVML